jgi:hypothetical protein
MESALLVVGLLLVCVVAMVVVVALIGASNDHKWGGE